MHVYSLYAQLSCFQVIFIFCIIFPSSIGNALLADQLLFSLFAWVLPFHFRRHALSSFSYMGNKVGTVPPALLCAFLRYACGFFKSPGHGQKLKNNKQKITVHFVPQQVFSVLSQSKCHRRADWDGVVFNAISMKKRNSKESSMKIHFSLHSLSKLFLVCRPRKSCIPLQQSYSLLTQAKESEKGLLRKPESKVGELV